MPTEPLLTGVRVIDMADQKLEMTGRYLADLGADVIRVEPPGGAVSRSRPPLVDGLSLYFATHNSNKRGVTVDITTDAGRQQLWRLLESADIWIESTAPGYLAGLGLGADQVLARFPTLVMVSVTDFGQSGPYRDYVATDLVQLALGTQLSRSGLPGREPLVPPGGMAHETSAMQAAWATLLTYLQRLDTGVGDHVDFSIWEATMEVMDPALGTIGTATAGTQTSDRAAAGMARLTGAGQRGRPTANPYPIFPCADGHVRLLILSPRQWRSMRAWLGEPESVQDPTYDTLITRLLAQEELYPLYAALFADKKKDDITLEGQRRGVPIAAVLTPADVLVEDHFDERGAFVHAEIAPGVATRVPSGFIEVDGARVGFRRRAPLPGEDNAAVFGEIDQIDQTGTGAAAPGVTAEADPLRDSLLRLPLEGIRVIDFGIIIFGAEVGRMFADMGAEVIKIENRAFPDGARQTAGSGPAVSAAFAIGHRNERSFGLNLRDPNGVAILKQLVEVSDVVLSNFKPGTLESLGLGYNVLAEVNPRLIWMSGSAVGHTGPWKSWLGYGPLVRCSSGLTSLWRYADDPISFSDPTTIYPDHYSARVAAAAVVAALVRRKRSGAGADIRISQAEATINHLAVHYVEESLRPGTVGATGNMSDEGAPWSVYPCAGDDEWCAITVRDDDDWRRFGSAIGSPPWCGEERFATTPLRLANREALDALVGGWTAAHAPLAVTELLQAAGVPAGAMRRVPDLVDDPQVKAREFIAWLEQPEYDTALPMENRPFHARHIPPPPLRPAPAPGEQTRVIAADLLGMTDRQIDELIADGVLEVFQ